MSIHINILIRYRVHMLFILYKSTRGGSRLPSLVRLFTAATNAFDVLHHGDHNLVGLD